MKPVKILIAISFLIGTEIASAIPNEDPVCARSIKVQGVPSGMQTFFDDRCQIVYVGPATKNRVRLRKYEEHPELASFCQSTDLESHFGGRAVFAFHTDQRKSIVAIQRANPKLKVVALPLAQEFISINEQSAEESKLEIRPAVLSVRFSSGKSSPDLPSGSRRFFQGIEATVTLSTIGACSISSKAQLNAYIVGNLTYGYWVQSGQSKVLRYGTSVFL